MARAAISFGLVSTKRIGGSNQSAGLESTLNLNSNKAAGRLDGIELKEWSSMESRICHKGERHRTRVTQLHFACDLECEHLLRLLCVCVCV